MGDNLNLWEAQRTANFKRAEQIEKELQKIFGEKIKALEVDTLTMLKDLELVPKNFNADLSKAEINELPNELRKEWITQRAELDKLEIQVGKFKIRF